jgi:AraC-like DNA-binding protein
MPNRPPLQGAHSAQPDDLRRPLAACLSDPWFAEELFDCLPDVHFFVKDRQARYVVVSEGIVRRAGARSKHELLGRTTLEVFPPPLGQAYYEQDRRVLDEGVALRDRLELHTFPHGRCWHLTQKFPLRDADGGVVGLAGTSRDVSETDGAGAPLALLALAITHLRHHYREPLRVDALAGLARLSVARFERAVKRIFRVTPVQLLGRVRLEAATHLLARSALSIASVAHECGYSDHSAFCRQFKAAVDMTPTEFRARRQRSSAPPRP